MSWGTSPGSTTPAIVSAVMYPIGADGEQFQRNLGSDERLGDSYLYPETSGGAGITGLQAGDGDLNLAAGTVSGSVRTSGGIAVPGAHVVALDSTGAAVVGDVSRPDGSYLLTGLYPGTYTVYAEPLDGVIIEQDLAQSEFMNSFYPFVTTFVGGNASPSSVTVIAGSDSAANDIDLGALYSVETEANNTYGAANPVALEALTSGIINPAGDVDYFSFPGTSGDFINIDVDASGDGYPLDPYHHALLHERDHAREVQRRLSREGNRLPDRSAPGGHRDLLPQGRGLRQPRRTRLLLHGPRQQGDPGDGAQ